MKFVLLAVFSTIFVAAVLAAPLVDDVETLTGEEVLADAGSPVTSTDGPITTDEGSGDSDPTDSTGSASVTTPASETSTRSASTIMSSVMLIATVVLCH